MRILQVVPTYLPAVRHGGPIRSVHGLARALVTRGHEVEVATTNLDGPGVLHVPVESSVDLEGVKVRYFPVDFPRRLARSRAMGRWLASDISRFDIVHLHSVFQWPTYAAARAAEEAGVPWLVSPRGMLVPELFRRRGSLRKRLWMLLVERRTLERASRIVLTSDLEREELLRFHLRLPAMVTLPNGVEGAVAPSPSIDPRSDAATIAFLSAAPIFLYLGRLSWKKGLDLLVRALARVPSARLLIAGNDDEDIGPSLDRLARECGVADRIRTVGFVDGEEKESILAAARALVLPSLSENFANVVLEAWAQGTPVVVTPGVGLAREVAGAEGGLVVERSVEALVQALGQLAADGACAKRMGERGRELARAQYSWPAIASQAEAIYLQVLAERGGAKRAGAP